MSFPPGRRRVLWRLSRRRLIPALASLFTLVTVGRVSPAQGTQGAVPPLFQNAVVAADHPLASEAGAEILRKGGNVVDAAVATSFALSVVRPESCGLGGGGFMVIWNASKQQAIALDYRERAPQRAGREMFLPGDDRSVPPPDSRRGGLAAAIPGNVAGLCYALEHYGSLDLPTVLAPAIRLATEGVPLDETAVRNQRSILVELERQGADGERFAALRRLYLGNGRVPAVGERFDSPLEGVLNRIAADGPAGFYQGDVAQALVAEVERQGGVWTADDLDPARLVVARQPLRLKLGDGELLTMPPPSSGGIAIIEALQILNASDAADRQVALAQLPHNGVDYVHRVTEAWKHAFADRATYLGDADFVSVPVTTLTGLPYARRLAERLDLTRTRPADAYGRALLPDDAGTSHLSVMDAAGNAVACTETINTGFGSFVVEPTYGIILNNEMDDFTARPGEPNAFGLIQSLNNAVAPGKKPLSSMSPTIIVRNGQAELAIGGSGGPKIITATMQVLLNVTRFGMPIEEAIAQPRFHHQWQPDELALEPDLLPRIARGLTDRGHAVKRISSVAVVQGVERTPTGLRGVSDFRKGGAPAGW